MLHSGLLGGLALLLDAEQYEYMPTTNSGAGFRVILHNQTEVIKETSKIGHLVSVGSKTDVGVQRTQVRHYLDDVIITSILISILISISIVISIFIRKSISIFTSVIMLLLLSLLLMFSLPWLSECKGIICNFVVVGH